MTTFDLLSILYPVFLFLLLYDSCVSRCALNTLSSSQR